MIDPIVLSTVTSMVSVLAAEFGKGVASEAGKDIWKKIKPLIGLKDDVTPAEVPVLVAQKLTESPELIPQVVELVQGGSDTGTAGQIVNNIIAKNIGVVGTMYGNQTFN